MHKLVYLLLILFSFSKSIAQFHFDYDEFSRHNADTSNIRKSNYIKLTGTAYEYSTAITNSLRNAASYDGYISDQEKEDSYQKLNGDNGAMVEGIGDIEYKHRFKPLNLWVRFRDRSITYSHFNDEFFKFLLDGNKQYEGQSIEISPYDYFKITYQSAMLGVEKSFKGGLHLGLGISYLRGGKTKVIEFKNTHLYTAPYGEYVELTGNIHMHETTSEQTHFQRRLGNGLAMDFYISKDLGKKSQLSFSVQDLGKIYYDNVDRYYSADTTVRFDGIEIASDFSISDSIFNGLENQKVEEIIGLENTPQSVTYTIPAIFHFNYKYQFKKNILFEGGLRYVLMAYKTPQVYIKSQFIIKNHIGITPIIAYGGLSNGDLGLTLSYFNNSFSVNLDLFIIETLLLPRQTTSQGAGLSIGYLF